jgi:hypothetical protein
MYIALRNLFVVIAIAYVVVAVATVAHGRASAHTDGGTLALLYIYEDQFHNWDFKDGGASVDWPISIIFGNNANVNKVKNAYKDRGWWGGECGSAMWGHYNDGYGLDWDTDDGVKGPPCIPGCFVTAYHMRVYALPSTDRMYNVGWGYYVFASTHQDRDEACPFVSAKAGWSETAEDYVVNFAINSIGWSASHDWANFFNYNQSGWQHNTHYLQSNGCGSWVNVP